LLVVRTMINSGEATKATDTAGRLDASVVICTCSRADQLTETLRSLAGMVAPATKWEVVVVDNNSTDHTRAVVADWSRRYPVPLRYLFEARQGKSIAVNAGIEASAADVVAFTDDDVRVPTDWLQQILDGLNRYRCDYVGGRVIPLWERQPPSWFPSTNGLLWGVVALLDYGPDPIDFGTRVPLGVNMAVRRTAFEQVGVFDTRIGRKAGTLLGQAEREWCLRARAAGFVGYYLPDAVIQHLIPANRLTKRYFRRWFYWRGITRAMMYAHNGLNMEHPESSSLNYRDVPHLAGVPRYMFRSAARAAYRAAIERLRHRRAESFERELWLWSFAGIVRQRWADRHTAPGSLLSVNRAGVNPGSVPHSM
jgi:glucosyl-dolichyl phosphate glucuronosyltransferase